MKADEEAGETPALRNAGAALAADGGVGVVDGRGELAGVEGAETGVEFGGGQGALAVEQAEEIGGGTLSFQGIAFEAGGNQVAIGVAPGPGAGHDVVEALDARVGAAQTIKTMAAFAEVEISCPYRPVREPGGRPRGPVVSGPPRRAGPSDLLGVNEWLETRGIPRANAP